MTASPTVALGETIDALVADASIEMTPRDVRDAQHPPRLRPGTSVYMTHLPSTLPDVLVDAAVRVREWGFTPVPHLSARALGSRSELDGVIAQLVERAEVDDLVVIAGSVARPRGPFASTMDVLDLGILEQRGIRRLGVAGHPEGSPDISERDLALALEQKNEFARRTGVEVRLITQFGFDAAPVVSWERRLREVGNELPVRVGVAGLASPAMLIKFSLYCGIGPSLTMLRKQTGSVLRLATSVFYTPDKVIAEIAQWVAADPSSLIESVHIFPFGTHERSADWLAAVQAGEYDLDGRNLSFTAPITTTSTTR